MSDLNPMEVPITLGGEKRHFLFTMNVFDTIQDRYQLPVFDVITRLAEDVKNVRAVIELTTILVNDEARRKAHFGINTELKTITEEEAGWLITIENMGEVSTAILQAFGIATPEPDEDEDEDPN